MFFRLVLHSKMVFNFVFYPLGPLWSGLSIWWCLCIIFVLSGGKGRHLINAFIEFVILQLHVLVQWWHQEVGLRVSSNELGTCQLWCFTDLLWHLIQDLLTTRLQLARRLGSAQTHFVLSLDFTGCLRERWRFCFIFIKH